MSTVHKNLGHDRKVGNLLTTTLIKRQENRRWISWRCGIGTKCSWHKSSISFLVPIRKAISIARSRPRLSAQPNMCVSIPRREKYQLKIRFVKSMSFRSCNPFSTWQHCRMTTRRTLKSLPVSDNRRCIGCTSCHPQIAD
jgi:hypothetical protein